MDDDWTPPDGYITHYCQHGVHLMLGKCEQCPPSRLSPEQLAEIRRNREKYQELLASGLTHEEVQKLMGYRDIQDVIKELEDEIRREREAG